MLQDKRRPPHRPRLPAGLAGDHRVAADRGGRVPGQEHRHRAAAEPVGGGLRADHLGRRHAAGGGGGQAGPRRAGPQPGRSLIIGFAQCLALIPGVSRSGATISVGLMRGLDRVTATRLAFLLGIPALLGRRRLRTAVRNQDRRRRLAAHPDRHGRLVRGRVCLGGLAAAVRRRAHDQDLRLVPLGAGRGDHRRAEHGRAGGDMSSPEGPTPHWGNRTRPGDNHVDRTVERRSDIGTAAPAPAGAPLLGDHGDPAAARSVNRQHVRCAGRPDPGHQSGRHRRSRRPPASPRGSPTSPSIASSPRRSSAASRRSRRWPRPPGLTVEVDDRLAEVDYGDWAGRPLRELATEPLWRTVQHHASATVFPGGESLAGVSARAVEAVRALVVPPPEEPAGRARRIGRTEQIGRDAPGKSADGTTKGPIARTVLICSHGDVIKALLADALGLHLDSFQRIVVAPASLSVIRYTPLRPFVERINDTGELRSLRPVATRCARTA